MKQLIGLSALGLCTFAYLLASDPPLSVIFSAAFVLGGALIACAYVTGQNEALKWAKRTLDEVVERPDA